MIYDNLNDALDQLIQGEQKRIHREYDRPNGRTEHTTQLSTTPSLWQQLNDATAYQGNGGTTISKSRLPITAGIVDIINEATTWTREAITEVPPPPGKKRDRNDIPGGMRAVIAHIISTHNETLATDWTKQIRTWVTKAREQLQLNPPHPQWARGTRCPQCGAKHALGDSDDGPTRTPALAINWSPPEDTTTYPPDPWIVRAVECRACLSVWWRGSSMSGLIDDMLKANATHETMTAECDTWPTAS